MAARVVEPLDEAWAADCRKSGLSSGEGLIYAVRDPIMKQGQWSIPPESAGDGMVYGLNVIHRKPPVGTLRVNQEGTAHELYDYFYALLIARRIRVVGEIRGFISFIANRGFRGLRG